jgi:hypothetical protein
MTDTTQSANYGEPSASTVELDASPAWLNLDAIISVDERERAKDLIEEGRALLVKAAAWGREAVPLTIHSWPESTHDHDEIAPLLDHLCGIDELEELCRLFTIAAGHRHDIDNDYAKRMRDARPDLGLHTIENDDPHPKNPLHDSIALLLASGYAIVKPDGTPFRAADVDLRDLNPLAAEAAARLMAEHEARRDAEAVEALDEVRCRRLVIIDETGAERIVAGRRGVGGISIEIDGEDHATGIHIGVSDAEGGPAASIEVASRAGSVAFFADDSRAEVLPSA